MYFAPPARIRSSPAMSHPWDCRVIVMMHYSAYSGSSQYAFCFMFGYGADLDPIGLGQQWLVERAPEQLDQRCGRKAVGKSVTRRGRLACAERVKLLPRVAQ